MAIGSPARVRRESVQHVQNRLNNVAPDFGSLLDNLPATPIEDANRSPWMEGFNPNASIQNERAKAMQRVPGLLDQLSRPGGLVNTTFGVPKALLASLGQAAQQRAGAIGEAAAQEQAGRLRTEEQDFRKFLMDQEGRQYLGRLGVGANVYESDVNRESSLLRALAGFLPPPRTQTGKSSYIPFNSMPWLSAKFVTNPNASSVGGGWG
jgi:hypothetical protein